MKNSDDAIKIGVNLTWAEAKFIEKAIEKLGGRENTELANKMKIFFVEFECAERVRLNKNCNCPDGFNGKL